jgi:hypothetical protein
MYRCFGGTYCLHLRCRNMDVSACSVLRACLFIDLHYDSENGSDMFLRNLRWISPDYTALCPKRLELFKKIMVFWNLVSCSLVNNYQHFGDSFCLYLQFMFFYLTMEAAGSSKTLVFKYQTTRLLVRKDRILDLNLIARFLMGHYKSP